MTDQDKFNEWADQFEPESDRWEDMGRDEVFIAGMKAAREQSTAEASVPDAYSVEMNAAASTFIHELPHGPFRDLAGKAHFKPALREACLVLMSKIGVVEPILARYQACGCVVCRCGDREQCHGCGAKNCGTHAPGEIPSPRYE